MIPISALSTGLNMDASRKALVELMEFKKLPVRHVWLVTVL
jgi:hypothetical protein